MKSVYPGTAKRLIPYIEEECDRLEYTCLLYTSVFDGLQNPLPDLAEQCGFFLERGVYLDPIPDRDWELSLIHIRG